MQQEVIDGFRLSTQQQRLWPLLRDSNAYEARCTVLIEGPLQPARLKQAFQRVIGRHEILRTAYRLLPGLSLPLQVINAGNAVVWCEADLSEFGEREQQAKIEEYLQRAGGFDVERGDVIHPGLLKVSPERHILFIAASSLCADSWTMKNLVRELGQEYADVSSEETEVMQYADFCQWQHELLESDDSGAGREYWSQQDLPVTLRLPLENEGTLGYEPAVFEFEIDSNLTTRIEKLALRLESSVSTVLLVAWSALLSRLTGETDIVVATAFSGRKYEELYDSFGLFAKYLPVRSQFEEAATAEDAIKSTDAVCGDVNHWQEYFPSLETGIVGSGIGFEFEEEAKSLEFGTVRASLLSVESCWTRMRLVLRGGYSPKHRRLSMQLRFDSSCFNASVMELLAERFAELLKSLTAAPGVALGSLPLLGQKERLLLSEWGQGPALKKSEKKTLGELLARQAEERGEELAIVAPDESLTFNVLNERANQLARYLTKRGVGPESVVAIMLPRTSRMIVSVCAVLKAGGAYLPLDTAMPAPRLEKIIKQAGAKLVLTEESLAAVLAGTGVPLAVWETINAEVESEPTSELDVSTSVENIAYVIYTSGSTGEPKGVMVEQRSALNLLAGLRQEIYGSLTGPVGLNAPLSFDASVKQLLQLLLGKTLVLIPEELRLEGEALLDYLAERHVEALDCTPAQLRLLLGTTPARWPRLLLVGGEAIDVQLWQQLAALPETRSFNLYGPTEATVDTTTCRITADEQPGIGRPLPNVRVYVLNAEGEPVALGQVGELYIGGAGLARGYLNDAALTAQRFVPDRFSGGPGARLYRTGDLVRYGLDARIEYVGRTDHQVKVRGYRIELGEIEAALMTHPGVREAAATLRQDESGEQRLVGYVVSRNGDGQPGAGLHRLPNGMVITHQNRTETDYLYNEIFEEDVYLRYGLKLPQGACVFDVGANIGMFSLYVSERSRGARIFAFEPIAAIRETLQRNAELCRGADVTICPYGLAATNSRELFSYYPQFSARSGLAEYADAADEVALIKQYLRNREALGEAGMESLAELADELLEGVFESRNEECELRSLSDVVREQQVSVIDLLKIDVQRAELDVLKGISEEDWAKIKQISMEVHDKDGTGTEGRLLQIKEMLNAKGFEVAVDQDETLQGTDRYNLYARQVAIGGLQRPEVVTINGNNGNGWHQNGWSKLTAPWRAVESNAQLYRLPNQLHVTHQNRNETEFIYDQIYEQRLYLKHGIQLRDGDCVFDVGANIGLFTLFVLDNYPRASVFAFEPIPSTFSCLRENVARYRLPAVLYPCALSNRNGAAQFTFYPKWSASSSLYADVTAEEETLLTYLRNQGEEVARYAGQLVGGRYQGEQVECRLRRLSEVIAEESIERIDLLKLDVEKSESDVLEGIEERDWEKIRQLVVEVHDLDGRLERMQQMLEARGYVVEVEQDAGLVGTNIHSLYARRIDVDHVGASAAPQTPLARLWSQPPEADEIDVNAADLRRHLRERLPEYMVPQVIVKLPRMPLSRHGKVDRKRLPAPEEIASDETVEQGLALSAVEELLTGIWGEVLQLKRVGRDDNFFELGGHSLLATQVMSRVREAFEVEVPLRELFERPTIRELGESIERELGKGVGVEVPPIVSVDREQQLPLSFAQQRLWFFDQMEPGSDFYNVPAAVRLTGSLDVEALERTLTEVVRRHEVLRTTFASEDGRPVQVIHPAATVELPLIELSHLQVEEREDKVRQLAQAEAAQPFDLSHGPLLRAQLLRLSQSEHVVLFNMHHIVSDGWSIAVLIKEVGALYTAFAAGEPVPLEDLSIQYADFALWQRDYLSGDRLEQQLDYWRRQLHDAPTLLDLPADHPRPAVQGYSGALHTFSLPAELSESLKELSRRKGATLYMTLLAAFSNLLQRYTHAEELLIGTPIAGRNHREIEELIGIFINTLVLRVDLSSDPSFRELLQRVRRVCLEAHANQDVPFEKIVEELQPERSLSHTPFFQVMFVLQNTPQAEFKLPGLRLNQIEIRREIAKFDLVLDVRESAAGIEGIFEYNTDLFESRTIERMTTHLVTLLEAIVTDPEQRLSVLPLLTAAEEQQLKAWNPACSDYPREHCVHQLFEAQVERTPAATALVCGEESLNYRELNSRANQLAHHLRQMGVGPEIVVGIMMERSVAMMCSVLAVLKAGGAYLPLDPAYPAERLSFMLADAGVKVVIS
ncbi:MAG TPA: amino acid adenylation domain-containing protein, partial [Pyrinomonadaceae bacterium]|nr:amino acid adenylation domain-containing protein [Pyrinomonadaceae bacterium]